MYKNTVNSQGFMFIFPSSFAYTLPIFLSEGDFMENTENLEQLIKEYSAELMKAYRKRSSQPEEVKTVFAEKAEENEQKSEAPPSAPEEPTPATAENLLDDKATFYASVRSGEGAFPIPGAKVMVKKDSEIISFLVTDENGNTDTVTLPAYPEKDSLSSETAREAQYSADIYAEGFQEKKNLPVSATGGAEIVLNAELVPNEERGE